MATMEKALRAKADKALNVSIRHNGKVATKRQMIDDLLIAGWHAEIKERVDYKAIDTASKLIVSIRGRGDQNIMAEEIKEAFRVINNPPNVKKYRLVLADGIYDITKTEYDYATEKVKKPWEMTVEEYVKAHEDDIVPNAYSKYGQSRAEKRDLVYQHKIIIQSALSEGKSIPQDVLTEYTEDANDTQK